MIAPSTAAVFVARPAELAAGASRFGIARLLDDEDLQQTQRFRHAQHRALATASRLLQRIALGWAATLPPLPARSLRFVRDVRGRPWVAEPAVARSLGFSVANTEAMVACAVIRDAAIGLDIEHLRDELPHELLTSCLTADERAVLVGLPPAQQAARFFALWTLKECYLKALGRGLDVPLDTLGFAINSAGSSASLSSASPLDVDWRFQLLDVGPRHVAALCVPGDLPLRQYWVSWVGESWQFSATEQPAPAL